MAAANPARLEEQLERNQQDLEDFFEKGTVVLHWVASDASILPVNQAELDLLGYTHEEYISGAISRNFAPIRPSSRISSRCAHARTCLCWHR
jgi:PAS domain-containing protein